MTIQLFRTSGQEGLPTLLAFGLVTNPPEVSRAKARDYHENTTGARASS